MIYYYFKHLFIYSFLARRPKEHPMSYTQEIDDGIYLNPIEVRKETKDSPYTHVKHEDFQGEYQGLHVSHCFQGEYQGLHVSHCFQGEYQGLRVSHCFRMRYYHYKTATLWLDHALKTHTQFQYSITSR